MGTELVSVIIPTYNRIKTLGSSIQSVLNQSYADLELIVIDDCSTDGTEQLVNTINDKRIRYIRHGQNKGPSGARNTGIEAAKGKYIAFHDSDDIWHSDKLQKQMELMEGDHELGMVYTAYQLIYNNKTIRYIPSKSIDMSLKQGFIYEALLKENKIGTPTMLIRKEILKKCGGFNENLRSCEDWELCLRIAQNNKIGFIDEAMVNAYSDQNGVNSDSGNIIKALCYLLVHYYKDMKKEALINEKVSIILETCINNDISLLQKIKDTLVPDIIKDEEDFSQLIYQTMRTCKFKNYYDNLIKIMETPDISQYLSDICMINKWDTIAIYGMGKIGELLYKYFRNGNVHVKYGIDKNGSSDIRELCIRKPHEIENDIDVIIVTITFDYYNVIKDLKNYTDCRIISVQQLFS
jgi:glycosyltransferase involved in cell wall biosynthesis